MKKTKFDSYCLRNFDVAEGCKSCVQGKKLVLFVSGKCFRNCKYCSLSNKRKNVDKTWANERECRNVNEVIEEAKESHACGAGITGGDPLLCLDRTLKFVVALKKEFGGGFHIHIYLPTEFVTEEGLKKLKKAGIDEVRFHPRFLEKNIELELERISLASKFWKIKNIGIEIPMFPDKIRETFYFIKSVSEMISFVNLNELEISETNFGFIKSRYKLNEDSYTIQNSTESGLEILKRCEKEKLGLKIHLCTAKTKNLFQYKNRIKLRDTLPFGYRTNEGAVRYFIIDLKDISVKNKARLLREFRGNICLDNKKKRLIISEKSVKKALFLGHKVERVEELPTFDGIELERGII